LLRVPKPALSMLATFVLVFASACSSSSGTPAPAASGAVGASGAPGASATLNASDPNSIISQVISSGTTVKSFHIKLALSGTLKAAALQSYASSSGVQITSDVKLDGTAIEGDVDVANQAAHLALNVPALAFLGNTPITGDIILVNNTLYYKVSLLGTKYSTQDLSSLGSSLGALASGLPVPSAAAVATMSLADEMTQLRTAMQQAGVTATLVGTDQIGGKSAYHINLAVPLDKINAQIAAQASGGPAMTLDSASIDFWVYTDTNLPAQFEAKASSAALGNIDLLLSITNYDQPVTISAPAASDIQTAP
jgi:hypothetical protein